MGFFEAIILGLVQGLVEWLPLSSEGISALVMVNFFGHSFSEAVIYGVWLHLGTLLAAAAYFRKELLQIIKSWLAMLSTKDIASLKKEKYAVPSFVLIATIITGFIGGFIYIFFVRTTDIDGSIATAFIGLMLIITGLILKFSRKQKASLAQAPKTKDSLLVGFLQGFSIIPGISRSGITVGTLLIRKYDAPTALRLSFILSVPAIMGAILFIIIFESFTVDVYAFVAVLTSFIAGFITIKYFLLLARKVNFAWFCLILGFLSLLALLV